jgi:hypothetical protein
LQPKKFRLTPKAAARECSVVLLAVPLCGIVFCFGQVILGKIANGAGETISVLSVIFGFLYTAMPALASLQAILSIERVAFSDLQLTDKVLEYSLWRLRVIRRTWEDVEQIKKSVSPFQGELLILKKADVLGTHRMFNFAKDKIGATKKFPFMPLDQISGWKNGELRTELEKYAPHLFADQPTT